MVHNDFLNLELPSVAAVLIDCTDEVFFSADIELAIREILFKLPLQLFMLEVCDMAGSLIALCYGDDFRLIARAFANVNVNYRVDVNVWFLLF